MGMTAPAICRCFDSLDALVEALASEVWRRIAQIKPRERAAREALSDAIAEEYDRP